MNTISHRANMPAKRSLFYTFVNQFLFLDLPFKIQIYAVAQFVNQLGNFIKPVLVLFLSQHLHFSARSIGYYLSAFACLQLISSLSGSTIGDAFGRRKIYLLSNSFGNFVLLLSLLTSSQWLILIFISIWSVTKASSTSISNALIVDFTEERHRGRGITYLYMIGNIAGAVSPLIAVFLFNSHFKMLLALEAVSSLLCCYLVWLYCHDSKTDRRSEAMPLALRDFFRIFEIIFHKNIFWIFLGVFVANFVYGQYYFSLPIYVEHLHSEGGNVLYGRILSLNCVLVFILSNKISLWAGRTPSVLRIIFGSLFVVLGFSGHYFAKPAWTFYVLTLLWTIGELLIFPSFIEFISKNVSKENLGKGVGIMPVIIALSGIVTPMLFGSVVQYFGIQNVWIFTAILGSVSVFVLLAQWIHGNKISETEVSL